MKKPKALTQKQAERMIVDHNVPLMNLQIVRVRKAINKLNQELGELEMFSEILMPYAKKKGVRK